MNGSQGPTPVRIDGLWDGWHARDGETFLRLERLADPIAAWAVRVAATLRLPDLIAAGHAGLAALAEHTGVGEDRLRRLMRYLAQRDLFAVAGPDRYALTPMSELLCEGAPGGWRDALDLGGGLARLDRAAALLLDALRGGEPAYHAQYGRGFWDDLAADPERAAAFDGLMREKSRLLAPVIVAAYDWSTASHVVDVAGGNGIVLAEILRHHPLARGTLVERPGTAKAARPLLAAAGIEDRCAIRAGDIFGKLPAGADVYLLVNVLHHWDDARAGEILDGCARAAAPCGRVLIVEFPLDGDADQQTVTRMDLLMLLATGGRERTVAEYGALAAGAGMAVRSVTPTLAGVALVECVAGA